MRTHELKTWPSYFELLASGAKTFEFRNNDRDFSVGDLLKLREYDPTTGEYSGRMLSKLVTHVMHGPDFGLPEGKVIMSLVTHQRF